MEKTITFILIALFGFIAELIDGGLGMGYGVSASSLLMTIGLSTAITSALVHFSEIFTTFASGISHFRFGNVDRKIFTYLVISGVIGGVLGAYIVVRFQEIEAVKPIVSGILLMLGVLIISRNFTSAHDRIHHVSYSVPRIRRLMPLGFSAALIDAIGGGGWGPIATPSLIINKTSPRKAIGSVNLAEFFVTLAISITFIIMIPDIDFTLAVPLIIGGVICAPISALIISRINQKKLSIFVGGTIILLSLRILMKSFGLPFIF